MLRLSTWVKPPSGKFCPFEDLRGAILAGAPADIVGKPAPTKALAPTASFTISGFALPIGSSKSRCRDAKRFLP